MSDFRKCPHCQTRLEQTGAVLNLTRGKVHFRSWLCPDCGTRQETRRINDESEEVLLTSKPKAVIDAALNDRMEQELEGHRQFQSIGGRRHVERKHA